MRVFWLGLRVVAVLGIGLVLGAYLDRWATKESLYIRLENRLAALKQSLSRLQPGDPLKRFAEAEWRPKNSHLAALQFKAIRLPKMGGTGGGLQGLADGRILYATPHGEFGVLGTEGSVRVLPFVLEMNLGALKSHPVFQAPNFHFNWIRVTDIDVRKLEAHRHELLVGHHYFNGPDQCIELRLSRAVIDVETDGVPIVEPFRTVLRTTPCITFAGTNRENAIDAYGSGGRIARLPDGGVLFSTGDLNWAGTEGYPSVAADMASTLGKVLRVDVTSGAVSVYAKGVRNPQGLTVDSKGRVWETEHGPRGGDELNLVVAGGDFGWPDSTYGTDYGPRPWPRNAIQGRHVTGIAPRFSWTPSIGVSNLIEVTSNEFPLWHGDLIVASLSNQSIRRLRLEGDRVTYDEQIPFQGFRIRDITQLPDGRIAMITDQGYVLLVRNADTGADAPFLDARKQRPRSEDLAPVERRRAVAGTFVGPVGVAALAASENDTASKRGRAVFAAQCAMCHASAEGAVGSGPNLRGVVGRRVGATTFPYSEALARRGESWTPSSIVDFAVSPDSVFLGTAMSPVSLSSEERRDLEAYLRDGDLRGTSPQ